MKKFLLMILLVSSMSLVGCGGTNDDLAYTEEQAVEVKVDAVDEAYETETTTVENKEYEIVWITYDTEYTKEFILDDYKFLDNDMVEIKCHTVRGTGLNEKITHYEFLVHTTHATFMKSNIEE